ncbi:MAG: hypothetical protein ACI9MC_000348 [Kiritimatiellia bacterium]|jgi:hypothetical protein
MPSTTLLFLLIVGLIAVNQLVMRVAALRGSPWAFWTVQVLNLTIACGILLWGLPGFDHMPFIKWIFGLLLIFRIVQNNGIRSRYLRAVQVEAKNDEKKQKIRELATQMASDRAAEAQERVDEAEQPAQSPAAPGLATDMPQSQLEPRKSEAVPSIDEPQ